MRACKKRARNARAVFCTDAITDVPKSFRETAKKKTCTRKKLIILLRGNLINRQVVAGRFPVKRESKTWARESIGDLSSGNHAKKLTTKSIIAPNVHQNRKKRWKCCNHYFFECATILRACCDHHNVQVTELSRECNCGDLIKEVKKNGLRYRTRKIATVAEKLVLSTMWGVFKWFSAKKNGWWRSCYGKGSELVKRTQEKQQWRRTREYVWRGQAVGDTERRS